MSWKDADERKGEPMSELKYFTPILKWLSVVADEKTDVDADPQVKGIFAGCTVTPTIAGSDARAVRAEDLTPSAALLALAPFEARLDDGRLMLRADSDKAATSFANMAAFPGTGATNHLYRALDTDLYYEWTGTEYVLSVDYARLRLLANCPVLELPDDITIWYEFRFHHVTYNGSSQALPTIMIAAPTIAEVHDDLTDGEIVVNLATSEWIGDLTPASGEIFVRNIPDEVDRVGDTIVFKRQGIALDDPVDISDLLFQGDMADILDATPYTRSFITGAPDATAGRALLGDPLFIDVASAQYGGVVPATSNPEVGIQAAITYASANGIPEVIVSRPGTYTVDLHVIPGQSFYAAALWGASNVKLTMKPGVVIKLKNSATLPGGASSGQIIGGDAASMKTGWVVEGGVVDGNAANQSALTIDVGVALRYCRSSSVKDVLVKSLYGTASAPPGETLHFDAAKCRDVHFIGCEADGSASANTATGFSANHSFGVAWTDCVSHNMGFGMGFTNWMSGGLGYANCRAYSNGASGFNAERSEGITYNSCIAGGRSPFIEGTAENPFFPSGQTSLGNGVGFSIQGCTDVVGVGNVSTRNGINLSIYTNSPSGLGALVCTRVMFSDCDLRNATSTEVHVEKAADGGGAQDQVEVEVIDCLSGGGSVPDSIYNFGKAPLINYYTGSSGIRMVSNDVTGAYAWRWLTAKVTGPISGGAVMGINPDGQLHTSGRKVQRRATAINTTITLQDEIIAVTDTSATRTITLPSAATAGAGATYTVKDESGGAATNNITIARAGSDTIDGATSKALAANYGWVRVMSTGTGWDVIAESNRPIDLASTTVTGTKAQFNTALSDADFATLTGTEALTGKTVDLASNTVTGTTAQFNTALSDGDFATLAGAETLGSKTLTSPVINTSVSGSAVSTGTTVSTLALRDTNANLSARNYLVFPSSTVTAAGTTTLTVASTATQVFTGSTTQTVKLPTTGVQPGHEITIANQSSGAVTVQSSGANTIATVAAASMGVFKAFIATPTAAADWKTIFNA